MGSVPETRATITATVAPMTSATLPPSIAKPSTTPALSTFATATGSPSLVTPTTSAPPPPATTPPATSSTSSSMTQASPEAATTTDAALDRVRDTSLSTGAIAGIAVGSVAVIAVVFSILFFLMCLRKKRRSKRWSVGAFPPTPPGKDPEEATKVLPPSFSPNQRYYAAPTPEEKRRSFWRKSINPVDIGVAVSPGKVVDASPALSEQSGSGLLSNSKGPSLWPAPLMSFPLPPKGVPVRQAQPIPVPDEQRRNGPISSNPTSSMHAPYETRLPQPPQQLAQLSYSRPIESMPSSNIQAPYETRLSQPPHQLTQSSYSQPLNPVPSYNISAPYETRLNTIPQQIISTGAEPPPVNSENQIYNEERARGAAITGRIPLTPIYDNGTFAKSSQNGRPALAASRWDTPDSMNRLVPSKTARPPMGLNISNATLEEAQLRTGSARRSVASDSTMFEEDTTPEEDRDRQIRLAQSRSLGQYSNGVLARIPEGDSSPIHNLAYPRIPRPAVVSSQAQHVPRPLAGQSVNTMDSTTEGVSRGLSQRYEMNRAGQSYLRSDSSSSGSAPSLLAQRRIGQQKDLRIKTHNAAANAMNSRWQISTQPVAAPPIPRKEVPARTLQARPSLKQISSKAKVTPKTNSRGDLYLTVED